MVKINPIVNNLKYPPLRPKKLPDRLIWHGIDNFNANMHEFHMFTINSKPPMSILMRCLKTKYDEEPSLLISLLVTANMYKGMGSQMLKFAENFSRKLGCEGRLKLLTSSVVTPHRLPHIFYRKFGFTSGDPKIDNKLDEFIKNKKNATYKDFYDMHMYYDPNNKTNKKAGKKLSIWEKIKGFFLG